MCQAEGHPRLLMRKRCYVANVNTSGFEQSIYPLDWYELCAALRAYMRLHAGGIFKQFFRKV